MEAIPTRSPVKLNSHLLHSVAAFRVTNCGQPNGLVARYQGCSQWAHMALTA